MSHQASDDSRYIQRYADRPKPARKPHVATGRKVGRPLAIQPGSPEEREFKRLWEQGTITKVIEEELGISHKVVNSTRKRLKLPARKLAGVNPVFSLAMPAALRAKLERAAFHRGLSLGKYIRHTLSKAVE